MELPLYRINDQVVFTLNTRQYVVGIILAIEYNSEWVYTIRHLSSALTIKESEISGVLFESRSCNTREQMEAIEQSIQLPDLPEQQEQP